MAVIIVALIFVLISDRPKGWVENFRRIDVADKVIETTDSVKGPFDVAFIQRFNEDLPESLNQSHRMLVVAGGIDSSTERIVQYLATSGIRKVGSE